MFRSFLLAHSDDNNYAAAVVSLNTIDYNNILYSTVSYVQSVQEQYHRSNDYGRKFNVIFFKKIFRGDLTPRTSRAAQQQQYVGGGRRFCSGHTRHNLSECIRFLHMYINLCMGTYTRVICCGNTAEVERQVKGRRSISYNNNIIAYLTHTTHVCSECVCVRTIAYMHEI